MIKSSKTSQQISLNSTHAENKIEIESLQAEQNDSNKQVHTENEQKNDPSKIFRIKETQKVKKNYLNALMVNELEKQNQIFRPNFLDNHKLSSDVRVRMVIIYFFLFKIFKFF